MIVHRLAQRQHWLSRVFCCSRLGDMYRFADHHAAVQGKHENNRVALKDGALGKKTKGNVLMGPVLRYPVGHERHDSQSSWDGCALEVLRFPALILWEDSHSDIEPSQASQPTEDEEGQEEMVDACPNTQREGGSGGSKTEGNLREKASISVTPPIKREVVFRTKSASESSSCPINDDFLRHRAIFPSMKSKNKPNGMNARAAHSAPRSAGSPRQ